MQHHQVCHIIPFGLLNYSMDMHMALKALEVWYGEEAVKKARQLLCKSDDKTDDNTCILDEPANMLTLHGQLHKFWAEGLFMLKPTRQPYEVPAEDDSVTTDVQTTNQSDPSHSMSTKLAEKQPAKSPRWCQKMTFNWLGHTDYKMDDTINFNDNPRHKSKPIDHKTVGATSLDPWEPVLNGRLIKVYADRKADLPSYDLLQLQANILTAFSLAATADPMFYESDDDDDSGAVGEFSEQKQEAQLLSESDHGQNDLDDLHSDGASIGGDEEFDLVLRPAPEEDDGNSGNEAGQSKT